MDTLDIRRSVVQLFEEARKARGMRYEPERFMAFLTEPPARRGRRAPDTFGGRHRFVRFMESVEIKFGVCFTLEEWERGFSVDEFVQRIENKLNEPGQSHRLAVSRLAKARPLDGPIKVGLLTSPLLLVGAIPAPLVIRALGVLLWMGLVGSVLFLWASDCRHAKKLVERTRVSAD